MLISPTEKNQQVGQLLIGFKCAVDKNRKAKPKKH